MCLTVQETMWPRRTWVQLQYRACLSITKICPLMCGIMLGRGQVWHGRCSTNRRISKLSPQHNNVWEEL
jgi:hypothetical protein